MESAKQHIRTKWDPEDANIFERKIEEFSRIGMKIEWEDVALAVNKTPRQCYDYYRREKQPENARRHTSHENTSISFDDEKVSNFIAMEHINNSRKPFAEE